MKSMGAPVGKKKYRIWCGFLSCRCVKTEPHPLLRVACHALLAIFLANAANKFFVVDLDYELAHGFYARIFDFQGDAPDQYRILPLLPLKFLCQYWAFNHAVLVYNALFGFAVLELLWMLSRGLRLPWRWGMSFGLGILYIFTQYTGWRPDTMGLLFLCCCAALVLRDLRGHVLQWLLHGLCIVALSLSRAEIALVYALFATVHVQRGFAAFIPVPILLQIAVQQLIFPDAVYYSKTIMLMDNLALHYLLRNPATYLIAATAVAFGRSIVLFVGKTYRRNYYFYFLVIGYFLLVFVIGRLNEYRLYLPFVPLLLLIVHGTRSAQGNP
jgi:hypothetical protein